MSLSTFVAHSARTSTLHNNKGICVNMDGLVPRKVAPIFAVYGMNQNIFAFEMQIKMEFIK